MFALRQQLSELGILELKLDVLVEIILDLGVDALSELADRSLFVRAQFTRAHDRLPLVGALVETKRVTLQPRVRQFCDRTWAREVRPSLQQGDVIGFVAGRFGELR